MSRKLEVFILRSLMLPVLPTLTDESTEEVTPFSMLTSRWIWSENLAIGSRLSSILSVMLPF